MNAFLENNQYHNLVRATLVLQKGKNSSQLFHPNNTENKENARLKCLAETTQSRRQENTDSGYTFLGTQVQYIAHNLRDQFRGFHLPNSNKVLLQERDGLGSLCRSSSEASLSHHITSFRALSCSCVHTPPLHHWSVCVCVCFDGGAWGGGVTLQSFSACELASQSSQSSSPFWWSWRAL